jgi:endonuclease/exonuclease/phosphatase family metal-dependent hydrolase
MQLNIWAGRLEREIKKFVENEQPDIVCLQEAISFDSGDTGMFFTVENIQQSVDLEFVAFAPVFSFSFMGGIAKFGNCVLSRYPIQKTESIFTHLEYKDNFDFNTDSVNVRNFINATMDIDGTIYHVVTHHGFHVPDHKEGNEETLRQMSALGDYIDQIDGNIILTGDFNLAPHSKSLEIINQRLINQSIKAKLKTTRNQLTHKTEVCDYIFTSNDVQISSFKAADDLISDHKALLMEFST